MSDLRPVSPPSRDGGHAEPLPRRGWYPDPRVASRIRFWDGVSWTAQAADEGDAAGLEEPVLRDELYRFVNYLCRQGADDPRLASAVPAYTARRCRPTWKFSRSTAPVGASAPVASARLRGLEPPPAPLGA